MLDLVVGDRARDVPFEAVGIDGRPVTLLAGQFMVQDSSVATLDGSRTVFAFHPREVEPSHALRGTLVVWRREDP